MIDLSGVGFAGSASLGIFVSVHREVRQNGGRLIFCNVEPTVREVFRASKLEPLFEFAADRAAALELIASGNSSASARAAAAGNGQPAGQASPRPKHPASRHRSPEVWQALAG